MRDNPIRVLRDYQAIGYKLSYDRTYQRGYVSRKPMDIGLREVYEAHGKRSGMLYILEPSYQSTRYCIRHYLIKESAQ